MSDQGGMAPRRRELQPDPNDPRRYASRRVTPLRPEPQHLPGAPERLERQAVRLERRSAWTLLFAPPIVVATFAVDPFGLIGVMLGFAANVAAIGAAYRNRPATARNAAGLAGLAYGTGSFLHMLAAPWVLFAFVPLTVALRWLQQARELRREAWRVTYVGRRRVEDEARRRRETQHQRRPHP